MTYPTIEFAPEHQAMIDKCRALLTQKIIREAETVRVLHEIHIDPSSDPERIRLATEAMQHAQTMTAAAVMEFALDMRQIARDELEKEYGITHLRSA